MLPARRRTVMCGHKQEAPVIQAEQRVVVDTLLRQWVLNPRVQQYLEMVKARALGQDLPAIEAKSL